MNPKLTSQAKRQELLLLSTPLQAAQASPEGWEKPPEWLGWTSDSRGQPSPSGAERCSQGCGRGSRGTAAGPAGKEEERQLSCVSPNSLKSAQRPKSAWRWSWAVCPGPRQGELSRPHSFSAQPGLGGGRQAPLSLSEQGAHHPLPRAPHWPQSPLTHPGPGPRRVPKLREAPGVLGNEEKGHRAKGTEKGRSSPVGSPRVEVGTLRVRKGPGSRVAPAHPFPPLPGL